MIAALFLLLAFALPVHAADTPAPSPAPTATPDALQQRTDMVEKALAKAVRERDAANTLILTLQDILMNLKAARGK